MSTALLQATGYRRGDLRKLLLAEHARLVWLGVAVGAGAAVVAAWPGIRAAEGWQTAIEVVAVLVVVAVNALFWVAAATRLALRGRLIDALRSE